MSPDLAVILDALRFAVSAVSIAIGLFFVLAGAIGVLRLPDFYTRLHAAGVTDTLGAELVLFGIAVQAGFTLLAAKIVLVGLLLFLTSPVAAHSVAHAAHAAGLKPLLARFNPKRPSDADRPA